MLTTGSRLVCAACGWTAGTPAADPYPFRCPNAGSDDGDHVLRRVLGGPPPACPPPVRSATDTLLAQLRRGKPRETDNPFVRYRSCLHSWHVAMEGGMTDEEYLQLVERVDNAVERIAGRGFRITPWRHDEELGSELGFDAHAGVWIKDETGNVSGSHKARHLMGVALYLEVLDRLESSGQLAAGALGSERQLAISSCGNAALAAAVVARSVNRELRVFVPDHASPDIVAQLEALGARVTPCPRPASGARSPEGAHADATTGAGGDPSYLAFRQAVGQGAIPFSCQGNENGLVIEGGSTIGYEIIEACGGELPDRLFVQVGGGALASACIQAFSDWATVSGGALSAARIHAVQTRGACPLKRAYGLVVDRVLARLAETSPRTRTQFATASDRARYILQAASPSLLDEVFAHARSHRSSFMWPWETEPRSIAGGILDDETYDWAAVVEGMVRTGGFPVVVDEATLEGANALAQETTRIDVDPTGSAGLSGLITLMRSLDRPRPDERIAVLFTGVRR